VITRRVFISSVILCVALIPFTEAQPAKVYHVGVVSPGGPYNRAVEGLRDGLREQGLNEGKQYVLHVTDTKGNLKELAADAASSLEREKVDVIFSVPTSITLVVKQATTQVPIVFFVGSDPVQSDLVDSFAKPGGRLTGVYSLSQELTGKRLEMLKQISPRIQKVAFFFDPTRPVAEAGVKSARDAARRLGIVLVDREVRSGEELQGSLQALKTTDADALFFAPDATIQSHASLIVAAEKTRKLPAMFYDRSLVADGGLASYGVSYYAVGQLAAKYVHKILLGAHPTDLPVERSERIELVLNARTARELGITIPQSILLRADEVIQ